MYSTKSRALICLTIIWLVVRIYPAVMGWSSSASSLEIRLVQKLLEYGVQRLHGGLLNPALAYGTVAHPEHYLYAHYPYPPQWFYAALYYCFGFAGVCAALYLLHYAALLSCFLVLDHCFSRSSAFWASVLYAVAPAFVLHTGMADVIIVGSIFWPIALAVIVFRLHRKETRSPGDLLLAGATAFLAGQTSWFALSIVPSLAVINSRVASLRPRAIRAVLTNPVSLAFLAGGVLGLLVFLGQVALYEGGVGALLKYSISRTGAATTAAQRLYAMALIPLRIGIFVGLALSFASLLGCLCLAKDSSLGGKELAVGAVVYFVIFGAIGLAAPSALFIDTHFYHYLVFPGAVMAAMLFERAGGKLRSLLLTLGGLSLVLGLMYASVPPVNSPVGLYLGKVLAAHSKKTDFIFTNIKGFGPPYAAHDLGAGEFTQTVADRLITFGVSDPGQLCVAKDLVDESTGFQYWRMRSLPVGSALEAELASRGKLVKTIPVTFPDRKERWLARVRTFVWSSVMKKGERPEQGSSGVSSDLIDIYRIELPAENLRPGPAIHNDIVDPGTMPRVSTQ
jgi:hypothetical protein